MRHLFPARDALALPPERKGHAAPPAIAAMREGMARAVAAGQWCTDPLPVEHYLDGVRVLRFGGNAIRRRVAVHFHGGGYRMGCPEIVAPYAAALAKRCGIEVVCPAYRLAPENPFPAGLNDGLAVLRALAREDQGPIILCGDSAGGGLATALALLAAKEGIALAGLILLSPWLDLRVTAASYDANGGSDPLFSRESAEIAARLYVQQGVGFDHPLVSPLLAPIGTLPPVLLSVGEGEVLLDDARTMVAGLNDAAVPVDYRPVAGMDHIAVVRGLALPGAKETFGHITAFIDRLLS